jgi:hypothetical protein
MKKEGFGGFREIREQLLVPKPGFMCYNTCQRQVILMKGISNIFLQTEALPSLDGWSPDMITPYISHPVTST